MMWLGLTLGVMINLDSMENSRVAAINMRRLASLTDIQRD